MGEFTKIAWCSHTFNPWWGCAKVPGDPACHNCYAEALSKRYGFSIWGQSKPRRTLSDNHWREPLKWNRKAEAAGVRARVFCASMADVFEDRRDLDEMRARLWGVIRETPSLDWLLLTKRPENIGRLCGLADNERANVWLGTTAVTQEWLDRRVPELLKHPAAVHFVSLEPLQERVDLSRYLEWGEAWPHWLDWVIVGGESGPKAREFDVELATDVVRQCAIPTRDGHGNATTCRPAAVFVKQLGAHPKWRHEQDIVDTDWGQLHDRAGADPSEWPADLRVQEFPEVRDAV